MKFVVEYDHTITKIGTVDIEANSEEEAEEKFHTLVHNNQIEEADEDLDEETWEVKGVF